MFSERNLYFPKIIKILSIRVNCTLQFQQAWIDARQYVIWAGADDFCNSDDCFPYRRWWGHYLTLSELIQKHTELTDSIIAVINDDDEAKLKQLDLEINTVFDSILNYRPDSNEDLETIIAFLLDQLVPSDGRSLNQERMCRKLMEMSAER